MTKKDDEREDLISLTEVRTFLKTNYKGLQKIEEGQKEFTKAMVAMGTRVTKVETIVSVLQSHAKNLWGLVLIIIAALLTAYFTDVFKGKSHVVVKEKVTENEK